MNNNVLILFLALIAAIMLPMSTAYSDENEAEVILDEAFENHQRPGSLFNHDLHMEMVEDSCNVCHHVYKDGKLVPDESSEDMTCSECHKLKSEDERPDLLSAYHKSCKECHEKESKGPITCGECHKK